MFFPIFPPLYGDWALFALRVVLGMIFLQHAGPKLKDFKAAAHMFDGMGFRPGKFWGPFVGIVENAGGLLLILGFLTQLVAAVFVMQFLVISAWKMRQGKKFPDVELDLLILVAVLTLMSFGAGSVGIDGALAAAFAL